MCAVLWLHHKGERGASQYRGGGPVHEKFTLPVRQNLNFSARKGYNKKQEGGNGWAKSDKITESALPLRYNSKLTTAPNKKEDDPMAKFYICRRCGNLAGMVRDSGVPMVCCGQKMEELTLR